jgi:predicted DNA-binding transcriptional regulator AlpA
MKRDSVQHDNTPIDSLNVLTPPQAARYVGVSEAVLRLWRSRGSGPRHFKAGPKLIRYRRCDLDAWIESRLSEPRPPQPPSRNEHLH